MSKVKLGLLISGRGSNMKAIIEACQNNQINAEVAVVISNNKHAPGIAIAKSYNIPTLALDIKAFASKLEYEEDIARILKGHNIDLICLAGYMRLLGKQFIQHFNHKIINIHPSLLPAFKGLNAQKQALEYGVKYTGCTVHFVDESLDGGPIIMQDVVAVLASDDEASLTQRILVQEHQLYPKAIQYLIENYIKKEAYYESIN
ncbi:phosphoribosylglycinamide formyltransferase [Candidatus Marinamargulisbacteria bacterium SCGC AG-414-C22]|nr:phosphoribosylglycinamide formyltransferase [Candidatus Marinamargulisbacteria bacterium SCGC AG-414-C22]